MSRWGVLDQAVRAMDINGDGMIHKGEFRQVSTTPYQALFIGLVYAKNIYIS